MASEKTVNYTAEQEVEMIEKFKTGVTVEALAEAMGKTTRSVIAKLTSLDVYTSKAKAKAETRAETKAELVARVEANLGLKKGVLESLVKSSRDSLVMLAGATEIADAAE